MILDLLTILFLVGGLALLWVNLRTGRDVIVTGDEQQRDNRERDPPQKQETHQSELLCERDRKAHV